MNKNLARLVAVSFTAMTIAACSPSPMPSPTPVVGPAGQPSSTNVNPVTGARGGTNGGGGGGGGTGGTGGATAR